LGFGFRERGPQLVVLSTGVAEGVAYFPFLVQAGVDGKQLYFIKVQVEVKCITVKTGRC
jgi:hypothetical protein